MSENKETSRDDEAHKETDESEERAMSVFASERKEDVIAMIIGFAFALAVVIFYAIGG